MNTAVKAARRAFETTWGMNAAGSLRGRLLNKLADLMEQRADELAALEALDNGKTFTWAKSTDVAFAINTIRYYAGWADKNHGQAIEVSGGALSRERELTRGDVLDGRDEAGVHAPRADGRRRADHPLVRPALFLRAPPHPTSRPLRNFPIMMLSWKIGPALATGNTIVLKPSEFTPLSAQLTAQLITEAGFPPGVVNIVNGYGHTVGAALSEHMDVDKVAFTGSTLVGRKVMEAAARTNLKNVTLELGGKSPNIVFDDADLDLAVSWTSHGILCALPIFPPSSQY